MIQKSIYIILLLSPLLLQSKARDVNFYGVVGGNTVSFEVSAELRIISFDLFNITNSTYIKYGASMIGGVNFGVAYTYPLIGIIHFFGDEKGLDMGINYFHKYYSEPNTDFEKTKFIDDLNELNALGFELGYRVYVNEQIIRITYTPYFDLDKQKYYNMFGFSIGWSF